LIGLKRQLRKPMRRGARVATDRTQRVPLYQCDPKLRQPGIEHAVVTVLQSLDG
jgi:hypothetical protein